MPLMLELGRQAGMDKALLNQWALVHASLLKDAQALFPDNSVSRDFSADDLACSRRVFGLIDLQLE